MEYLVSLSSTIQLYFVGLLIKKEIPKQIGIANAKHFSIFLNYLYLLLFYCCYGHNTIWIDIQRYWHSMLFQGFNFIKENKRISGHQWDTIQRNIHRGILTLLFKELKNSIRRILRKLFILHYVSRHPDSISYKNTSKRDYTFLNNQFSVGNIAQISSSILA